MLVSSKNPITICIIKPDAKDRKDEIIQKIKDRGYQIVEEKNVKFTEEMVKEFYKERVNEPHFNDLVTYMTSDESCVLALGKGEDVVTELRKDIGPTDIEESKKDPNTLRGQYATDQVMNAVHGSDSHEAAMR